MHRDTHKNDPEMNQNNGRKHWLGQKTLCVSMCVCVCFHVCLCLFPCVCLCSAGGNTWWIRLIRDIHARYTCLMCVAVCCSVLQCVAVCCSVLQCVAVCCSVLPCVVLCCKRVAVPRGQNSQIEGLVVKETMHVVRYCSALQFIAACCSMLQCGALSRQETRQFRKPSNRCRPILYITILELWRPLLGVSFEWCRSLFSDDFISIYITLNGPMSLELYRPFWGVSFEWYRSLLSDIGLFW